MCVPSKRQVARASCPVRSCGACVLPLSKLLKSRRSLRSLWAHLQFLPLYMDFPFCYQYCDPTLLILDVEAIRYQKLVACFFFFFSLHQRKTMTLDSLFIFLMIWAFGVFFSPNRNHYFFHSLFYFLKFSYADHKNSTNNRQTIIHSRNGFIKLQNNCLPISSFMPESFQLASHQS